MSKFDEYRAFTVIVEKQSLSQAAKALHLSPSAVSKKLNQLEQSLGVQLIDRSTRSLAITDLGKEFYRRCKSILAAVNDAESHLRDATHDALGKITLSCPRVLLQPGFARLLADFGKRFPNIRFDLRVSDNIEDLITGNIDFAFRIGRLTDSRLTALPLLETRPVFCASPDYLQRQGIPRQLNDLQNHTLLMPTYLNLSDRMRRFFPGQGNLDLDLYHTSDDVFALYQWVCAGGGMSLFLDIVVNAGIKRGELQRVFADWDFPAQKIVLLFNKQAYETKKMTAFKHYIQENFAQAFA